MSISNQAVNPEATPSTTLSIAGIEIRQDEHGRYCLNDLHKAAGGERRHEPANWMALQRTQESIAFLELENLENSDTGIPVSGQNQITGIPVIFKKQGLGTFVIKELVYDYAMWVSPKFNFSVIRAYDALVTGKLNYGLKDIPHQEYAPVYLTPEMCGHVQRLVNERAEKDGVHYNTTYRQLKDVFECNTYTEIPVIKYGKVCSFFGVEPIYLIPEYSMVDKFELSRLLCANSELERIKANPKLLPAPEGTTWAQIKDSEIIVDASKYQKMQDTIDKSIVKQQRNLVMQKAVLAIADALDVIALEL